VGNREFDPAYVDPILKTGIHYIDLPELRAQGMRKAANNFISMVEDKKLDGFWIHLDVDVLNTDLMPCVDSPEPDGLTYDELEDLLIPVLRHPAANGINLTILDPELDPAGLYTRKFIEQFANYLSKQNSQRI
jgi:arginase